MAHDQHHEENPRWSWIHDYLTALRNATTPTSTNFGFAVGTTRSIYSSVMQCLFIMTTPRLLFSKFSWAFVPIEPINVHAKFKSVASPVPEIIGVPKKFEQSLDMTTLPFLQKWAFVRTDPLNMLAKCEIRSFSGSWDNRGYPKNLGSPWIRPPSLFSKIFNGLLFGWTLSMY